MRAFGRIVLRVYCIALTVLLLLVVLFFAVIGWYVVNLDKKIDEDWVTFEESGACTINRPCAQQYVGKSQSCMVISGRLIAGLKNSSEYKELAALAFQGDENITKADFVETVKGGYTFCVVAASVRYAKYNL